jgi:uncharacterized protein (DUF1501 family)
VRGPAVCRHRQLIADALKATPVTNASTDSVRLDRVAAAVFLVMASAEYLVQKCSPAMHLLQPELHTRRAFCAAPPSWAWRPALPFALNLAAMGEAAAFNATDYKALVCVFLYGGNDYANTVVTYDDDSYNRYTPSGAVAQARRPAASRQAATPTLLTPPRRCRVAPVRAAPGHDGLAGLFNSGKAAVQLNVGPLVVPLTRAQYNRPTAHLPLPPKLFSHNDQQSVWQSSSPEGSTVGWGGNLGDLALSSNGNSLFTCISVTGNAVFLSGDSALQYQVSTRGAVAINGVKSRVYGSSAVQGALTSLMQQPRRKRWRTNTAASPPAP